MALLTGITVLFYLSVIISLFRRETSPFTSEKTFLHKGRTDMVKGIAAVAILIDHVTGRAIDAVHSGALKYCMKLVISLGGIGVLMFLFISGYGCYHSISRSRNKAVWLVNHIVSIVVVYLICFVVQLIVLTIVGGNTLSWRDIIGCILHLEMPMAQTWYVRVQLMAYVFLCVSMLAGRRTVQVAVLTVLCLISCIAFYRMGYVPHWWKSTMCFPLGVAVAMYKPQICRLLRDRRKLILICCIVLLPVGYVAGVLMDAFLPKVVGNMILCMCLIGLIEIINPRTNAVFKRLGAYSLHIYLLHVGFYLYFLSDHIPTNAKVFYVMLTTAVFSLLAKLLSDQATKRLFIRAK